MGLGPPVLQAPGTPPQLLETQEGTSGLCRVHGIGGSGQAAEQGCGRDVTYLTLPGTLPVRPPGPILQMQKLRFKGSRLLRREGRITGDN